MVDEISARRIAENNARFRAANERIARAADEHGLLDAPIPFVCECSDPSCVQLVSLPLEAYRRVRGNGRWFLHAAGHERELPGTIRPVEEYEGWVLVEKIGFAGDVAAELADGRPEA